MAINNGNVQVNGNGHTASSASSTPLGMCQCIPWQSSLVQNLPDPTRVFSLLVIAIMLVKYSLANDNDLRSLLSGFLLHPVVLVSLGLAVATLYLGSARSSSSSQPLPVYDRWAAEWYWWNAWLYHLVMDGGSGSFGLVPVVVQQYQVLDRRFITHHSVPWTVGVIEFFIMGPLCLVTLCAILKRHSLRFPLELIVSTFQFMGMLLFIVAEVYEGQLNVPALDPVGVEGNRWANVKFDLYHLTYYWFGFWFCNLIWSVVPFIRVVRAVQECQVAFDQQQKSREKRD